MSGVVNLFIFSCVALIFGFIVMWVSKRFKVAGNPVVEQINAILPQTQCGQCDFPGCKPYAQAIASGEAAINQCPPGGEEGIKKLAELLDLEVLELNPDNGDEQSVDMVVEVIEEECIGCTKCIQVCPVDAIIGAAKQMHTIILDVCTGCDLCIPACPVDCIIPIVAPLPNTINRIHKPQLFELINQAQELRAGNL
ncbi:MAG: electron transport complex subunit RsxB [Proteobacteria bacterium]|nr:electron transport complex subunit RsxB [Pseudomonadota bacterium]